MLGCTMVSAQTVKFNTVYHNSRNNDGDEVNREWVGSIYDSEGNYTGKTLYFVPQGLYTFTWDGSAMSAPVKEPEVSKAVVQNDEGYIDIDKAQWATNFNLMYANSGAVYTDGIVTTVMSRDEQSTVDEELFAVRQWDAKTGDLLSNKIYPKSATIESAGMAYYNNKVYGLFYLTGQQLPEEITSDPEYFEDQDADMTDGDAGYCLCTIDLATMTVTPITPGLYYYNFVAFAINAEGRAFALTSGGVNAPAADDGKYYDINGNLTGTTLCEFDLETGLLKSETALGYCSQYRRQSACFSKSNPNIMYWNGFYNSGKGINDYGSWGQLPDRTWKTNGKYDTSLYAIDVTTGLCTRVVDKIQDRYTFACMWADGDDLSDGVEIGGARLRDIVLGQATPIETGIESLSPALSKGEGACYTLDGRRVQQPAKGLYIINGKKVVLK